MVGDGAFSHKIDWGRIFLEILNLKRHQNRIVGSKVTAILLNGWVFPIGGVTSGRVCACSLRSRLVLINLLPLSCYNNIPFLKLPKEQNSLKLGLFCDHITWYFILLDPRK